MSHGRRMLEAQKGRTSGIHDDDGRVDDGHLRNIHRALKDDGTPVRSTRSSARLSGTGGGEEREREESGSRRIAAVAATRDSGSRSRDVALTSPPPRPGVQLGWVEGDSGCDRRRGRASSSSSSARPSVILGSRQNEGARDKNGGSHSRPSEAERGGAARLIDVDAASHSDEEECPTLSNMKGTQDAGDQSRGADAEEEPVASSLFQKRVQMPPTEEAEERGDARGKRSRSRSTSRGGAPRYRVAGIQLLGAPVSTPTTAAALHLANPIMSPHKEADVGGSTIHRAALLATTAPPLLAGSSHSSVSPSASSASSPTSNSASHAREPCEGPKGHQSSRSRSRSPSLLSSSSHLRSHLSRCRPAPSQHQQPPVTAAIQPTTDAFKPNPTNWASDCSERARKDSSLHTKPAVQASTVTTQRPPPLLAPPASVNTPSSTAGVTGGVAASPVVLASPASPPLRAGVSPRMLARHPARSDPAAAAAASFAASRAASASSVVAPTLSPSSQVQQHTPYEASQQQQQQMLRDNLRFEKERHLNEEDTEGEGHGGAPVVPRKAAEEMAMPAVDESGWHSIPPSPLPPMLSQEQSLPPLSPSSTPCDNPHALPPSMTVPQPSLPQARSFPNGEPSSSPALLPPTNRRTNHYPHLRDFSGFHNTGNDCYGCSALTMLLRSTVFRQALLNSPLVLATYRYMALSNRRSVRRAQWTSGYVEANTTSKTRTAKDMKKRRRADSEDGTVGEVCGLLPTPLDTAAKAHDGSATTLPPRFEYIPHRAVQQTIDLVKRLTLEELEDVLNVDDETDRLPTTLHAALAALVRAVRWREHMTMLLNAPTTTQAERERLLEEKIFHENDRTFDGQLYTCGIRLHAVAALFAGEFFLGEQEDAHELFVALMAKLETEAVDFQKRCAALLEDWERQDEASSLSTEGAATAPPVATAEGSTSSLLITGVVPPTLSLISTAMSDAWINTLVQTRLLNIIRCRSPGCHHEIVTDEVCVNLSLHIPEEKEEEDEAEANGAPGSLMPPTQQQPSLSPKIGCHAQNVKATQPGDSSPVSSSETPSASQEKAIASSRCSVSSLLHHSMAFEPLSDYKCDACGLKSSQYQGGCFYTRPPPVLVLQLKRFSTEFVKGSVYIRKNDRCVAVEDTLVVYALPSTEELRQHRGQPPRTVSLRKVEAETLGRTWARGDEEASIGAPSDVQEHCFFYDAEKKCFTTDAQECGVACVPCTNPSELDVHMAEHEETKQERETDQHIEELHTDDRASAAWVTAIRSVYHLQSTVLHLGRSLHYGHYVSEFAVEGEEEEETSPTGSCSEEGKKHRDINSDDEQEEEEEEEKLERVALPHTHSASSTLADASSLESMPLRRRLRWRCANDARVEVLEAEAVAARRAGRSDVYLLLYEKVQEEWVRCPVDAVLPKPIYPDEEA